MSLYKPSISVHQTILQTQALAMLRISYYIYNEFKARNLRIFKLNGMLFLVTFQASLNFIYEGIKCLYSILNCYQFMQIRTGYTCGSSENNINISCNNNGKTCGFNRFYLWFRSQNHKSWQPPIQSIKAHFSDRFEERTNKNTKKPLHVHYEHSMAKQLCKSEIC